MSKILVVDDDVDLAQSIGDWLLLEGHKADCAFNGQQALNLLVSNDYDVVVLDIMLGDMSGIDVCKRYRSNQGSGRILILTALDGVPEKEEGLDAGADDYICKPFDLKEISARIRALMRRSLVLVDNRLVVGDLAINLNTHEAARGEQQVRLLPQEFALLEFLMRHPNRIFDAETLRRRVWHSQSSIETVRTHIKTLRRKVDLEGFRPMIRTVHGVGYSLSTN